MKTGTKTYELSELIKLFQILKNKQKKFREQHINDNIEKEKLEQDKKFDEIREKKKSKKKYKIGDDYMEYIEEIQRKYESVINICLNEKQEEANIAKISYNLKQYILQEKEYGDKKIELLFIPGSLSEYFAKDKRFRQYFDDVYYLNEEINKRQKILAEEKKLYLNQYRSNIMKGATFNNIEIINNKYKDKKSSENEIIFHALFGNGISL